uniref:Uncharacterized protein n=1 Tax=Cucumis melo TaxID=3656 RepID=A0A9I9ELD4_CUCME
MVGLCASKTGRTSMTRPDIEDSVRHRGYWILGYFGC